MSRTNTPGGSKNVDEAANLADLTTCINYYRLFTPGLYVCVNTKIQLPEQSLQADIAAVVTGGPSCQCRKGETGFFAGAPNLIADVFPADSMLDYEDRRKILEQAGVREYLAWQVGSSVPVWNRLQSGSFVHVGTDQEGVVKSTALPGLWIDLEAFRHRNWNRVLAGIADGVCSRAHHEFMAGIWA